MADEKVIGSVRQWVESVVVGLNLCPFAKRELVKHRVRFVVTKATNEDQLLVALEAELDLLSSEASVATTLLIHPGVLQNFYAYNQFLNAADALLRQMTLEGVYQIASFHPKYEFAGTGQDDVENYTNRSPYPMLHLIREEGLERAIASYPDVDNIPEQNKKLMESLGEVKMKKLLAACFER